MILMCISLMTNDVEYLFLCLLPSHISSLVKCVFKYLDQLKIGLFVLLLSCKHWFCDFCYVLKLGVVVLGFQILPFIFYFGTIDSWNNSPSHVKWALPNTHWNDSLFRRVRQPCERMLMTGLHHSPGPCHALNILWGTFPIWRLFEML